MIRSPHSLVKPDLTQMDVNEILLFNGLLPVGDSGDDEQRTTTGGVSVGLLQDSFKREYSSGAEVYLDKYQALFKREAVFLPADGMTSATDLNSVADIYSWVRFCSAKQNAKYALGGVDVDRGIDCSNLSTHLLKEAYNVGVVNQGSTGFFEKYKNFTIPNEIGFVTPGTLVLMATGGILPEVKNGSLANPYTHTALIVGTNVGIHTWTNQGADWPGQFRTVLGKRENTSTITLFGFNDKSVAYFDDMLAAYPSKYLSFPSVVCIDMITAVRVLGLGPQDPEYKEIVTRLLGSKGLSWDKTIWGQRYSSPIECYFSSTLGHTRAGDTLALYNLATTLDFTIGRVKPRSMLGSKKANLANRTTSRVTIANTLHSEIDGLAKMLLILLLTESGGDDVNTVSTMSLFEALDYLSARLVRPGRSSTTRRLDLEERILATLGFIRYTNQGTDASSSEYYFMISQNKLIQCTQRSEAERIGYFSIIISTLSGNDIPDLHDGEDVSRNMYPLKDLVNDENGHVYLKLASGGYPNSGGTKSRARTAIELLKSRDFASKVTLNKTQGEPLSVLSTLFSGLDTKTWLLDINAKKGNQGLFISRIFGQTLADIVRSQWTVPTETPEIAWLRIPTSDPRERILVQEKFEFADVPSILLTVLKMELLPYDYVFKGTVKSGDFPTLGLNFDRMHQGSLGKSHYRGMISYGISIFNSSILKNFISTY